MKRFPITCLAVVLLLAARATTAAGGFLVVVNAANPVESLPAVEVSRIFMHRVLQWPSGMQVSAVDLPEDAPARVAFTRAVHGKTVASIKGHWQTMIFSGRDVPPPERSSAEVLGFVRSEVGAIGYVAPGTTLGDGVKILRVTP
jgi:ABC-type phosphate transport system substrate-binding protein